MRSTAFRERLELLPANVAFSFPEESDARYAFNHFPEYRGRKYILQRIDCEDGYFFRSELLHGCAESDPMVVGGADWFFRAHYVRKRSEFRKDGTLHQCYYQLGYSSECENGKAAKPRDFIIKNRIGYDCRTDAIFNVDEHHEFIPVISVSVCLADKEQKEGFLRTLEKEAKAAGFKNLHARVVADKKMKQEQEREQSKPQSYYKSKRYKEALNKFAKMIDDGAIRTSENTSSYSVFLGAMSNRIDVGKSTEWVRYTSTKSYPHNNFSYKLCVKRGYKFGMVGGLLTFWHGTFERNGMPCEWIEQGKGSKFNTFLAKKGFLVRDEHIEADSLEAAVAVSKKHRKKLFLALVKRRRSFNEAAGAARQYMNETVTFEDSLNAGNCRPGTQNFKDNVERVLGREVATITVCELIPLAIRFHQEYYVQRIFNMKGWKVNVNDFK